MSSNSGGILYRIWDWRWALAPWALLGIALLLPLLALLPPAEAQQRVITTRDETFVQTSKTFYDGSGRVEYVCVARRNQAPVAPWTFAGGTLTNIVVASNVATATTSAAHGLTARNGVTVGNTNAAGPRGDFVVATVPTTASFTFAAPGVGNGTYTTGLSVLTSAPRTTEPVWRIYLSVYDGGGKLTDSLASELGVRCADRAVLAYQ